ncbi:MAG TPA: transposase [Bacteroidales bacterium]|nr:transposase [Bacteroidales bacterium]HRS68550.1 transposase [Bacteroidales bacterium]
MKLSFKFKPKLTELQLNIIEELSFHTTKLYNIVNYNCRENGFKSYIETEKEYKENWHNQFLHSHTYQQCLKVLEKNWKSYFASIKDYKKNPNKYKGEPKPPKFKNHTNKKNEVIFTEAGIRVKNNILMLSLSKAMQEKFQVKSLNFSIDTEKLPVNFEALQQIKIKWDNSIKQWYLILIYNKEEENKVTGNNIISIDLGRDNLATLTFLEDTESYLIDGKVLKSKISYYNKEIARLNSIGMKQVGDRKKFKNTKQINKLYAKRNNFVNDYIHKASRKIIDLALQHNCNTIVIGDIEGIKQENDIKSFVNMPHQKLVDKIEYKAKLVGLKVVYVKENYTSGCSAFDLENINKDNYDKSRRIVRGLFRSNKGILVNSDVNGSLNILRKYVKDKCIPKLIQSAMDNGGLNTPLRIRVA